MSEKAQLLDPRALAGWSSEKMAKTTLHRSEHCLVGLNAFEPGQEHALHTHADMEKIYVVLEGRGSFLLEDGSEAMHAGQMMIAPAGVAHGVLNDSDARLLLLALLCPPPG